MEIGQHLTEEGDWSLKKQALQSFNLFLSKSRDEFRLFYFVFSLLGVQDVILVFEPISQLLQAARSDLV